MFWKSRAEKEKLIRSINIQRALDSSGAGAVLVQPQVDRIIANLVEYKNPLRQNLPRKPGSGQAWLLNRRSAPGTTLATWLADTTEPVEDNGTYARSTFTYRTLVARGKVTRKLQATGQTYSDVLMDEMELRALDVKDVEEQALLIGNNTADSAQPDGLCVLIAAGQCVLTTTVSGGEPLTLDDVDAAIDKCVYNPNMIISSKRTRRQMETLLRANQMTVNQVEVNGGFKLLSYNGIPVYVSTRMVDTKTFNGTRNTSETGGDTSELNVVDTEHTWVGDLTPLTMAPLAKTSSQFDQFDIYEDTVLVIRDPAANAKLIGISS